MQVTSQCLSCIPVFPYDSFHWHPPCWVGATKVELPWPAHDPPMRSFWTVSNNEPWYVTVHYSGYGVWQPGKDFLLKQVCLLHGVRKGRQMVLHMLPVIRAHLGIPAIDETSQGLKVNTKTCAKQDQVRVCSFFVGASEFGNRW